MSTLNKLIAKTNTDHIEWVFTGKKNTYRCKINNEVFTYNGEYGSILHNANSWYLTIIECEQLLDAINNQIRRNGNQKVQAALIDALQ